MDQKKHNLGSRLQSIGFAGNGLKLLFRQEPNTKIHLLATLLVIAYSFYTGLAHWQWAAIIFAIALVWITEALNTCIEMLCNAYCDNQYSPVVKTIKDIAAAAVLVASITSVAIASIIFIL